MVKARKIGNKFISIQGHAENKVVCGMITFASVNLAKTIGEYLGEEVKYCFKKGFFLIAIDDLSEKAQMFVEAYWKSLHDLQNDYPNSFEYIEEIPETDSRYKDALAELRAIVFEKYLFYKYIARDDDATKHSSR